MVDAQEYSLDGGGGGGDGLMYARSLATLSGCVRSRSITGTAGDLRG